MRIENIQVFPIVNCRAFISLISLHVYKNCNNIIQNIFRRTLVPVLSPNLCDTPTRTRRRTNEIYPTMEGRSYCASMNCGARTYYSKTQTKANYCKSYPGSTNLVITSNRSTHSRYSYCLTRKTNQHVRSRL